MFGQGLPVCQRGLSPYSESQAPLHRWVIVPVNGTGESTFDLCDNVYDAVSRGLDLPFLSPEIGDKLDKHFPSILSNWERQRTMHTCIHAELRVILHLDRQPIPVSTQSGLANEAVSAESHNRIFGTQWMTSGSHGIAICELGASGCCMFVCHTSGWEEFCRPRCVGFDSVSSGNDGDQGAP